MSKPHDHQHKDTFAEGQARDEHHAEDRSRGDFAAGQDQEPPEHEGTFAEGQAKDEHHPEHDPHNHIAEGQESEDND